MKNNIYKIIALIFSGLLVLGSCTDELDRLPLDKTRVTSETVYEDPASYKQALAKVYGSLAVTGQEGPAGDPDISAIDEGFSSYIRLLWYHQELPTDLAVIGWSDQTIRDFHYQSWTSSDIFVRGMYNRIFYTVQVASEYLRQTTDGKLNERGVTDELKAEIQFYRAEAKFIRALSYYHALDLFGGNVPFITEASQLGIIPPQTDGGSLYNYIESQLVNEIIPALKAPMTNEYARADKAAAWMLLAKLYLNAEVYIGEKKYGECIENLDNLITAGYSLEPEYKNLFLRDNHEASGIIFPVAYDGDYTQTWGGTTFLVHATVGGTIDAASLGINSGWAGVRTTSKFVEKFYIEGTENIDTTDTRAQFHYDGHNIEINDIAQFTDGYAIVKFSNVDKEGVGGVSLDYADTDFPVFRLADAYLMYAEATLRGGSGGNRASALAYMNLLRERAYGSANGNISDEEFNLDFILDERARELYWEGHRRTDLIRYERFSNTNYLWPWKGGVKDGKSVSNIYDVYPIPSTDINANPNLVQNLGY